MLADVTPTTPAYAQEVFGPVAPVDNAYLGAMLDLLDPGETQYLIRGLDINDAGQIADQLRTRVAAQGLQGVGRAGAGHDADGHCAA